MKPNFADELNRDDDTLHKEIFDLDLPPLPTPPTQIVVPDGAIVPAEHGWMYRQFELTPVGVFINENTNEDEWLDLGGALFKLGGAIQWLIGDWLVFGERKWGRTYKQIAEATGYDENSLYQFTWVCKKVDFSIRIETLFFGHHQLVAGKSPDEQRHWLKKALLGKWSISQMRKAMKGDPPTPPTPRQRLENLIVSTRHQMAETILEVINDPDGVDSARELIAEAIQYFNNLDGQLRG